jgi:hypothetical protein
MKTGNLLFSAVQFVFAMLIILIGIFFIGLQHAPHLRYAIADFFSQTSITRFSFIGYLILSCGILLLSGFYAMYRGIYYSIRMGRNGVFVDPLVIQQYVREYWKTVFPDYDLSIEVDLSKDQKIGMFVELPLLSPEKQQALLEKAENDLNQILQEHLGYRREFTLSVIVK